MICVLLGLGAIAAPPTRHPQIRGIEVKQPDVTISGAYLNRVEVWVVPTGTGITPDEYVLLGNAERSNAQGPKEIWLFTIPPCASDTRLMATALFAKAFDGNGTLVGTKSLSYRGVSALHEALCGKS